MENNKKLLGLLLHVIKKNDLYDFMHDDSCIFHEEEVEGEVGTGPWDTALVPGPCNCGLEELIKEAEKETGEP